MAIDPDFKGGDDPSNGQSEKYVDIDTQDTDDKKYHHYLKGYMLRVEVPKKSSDVTVTWKITKSDHTTPAGAFYSGEGKWTDYDDANRLTTPPTTPTAYWRSDIDDDSQLEYFIDASYKIGSGETHTLKTEKIKARVFSYNETDSDIYYSDVDMLQRLMIQVQGMNWGELSQYDIGKYQDNSGGYYQTKHSNQFSKIADEVKNFRYGAMHDVQSTEVNQGLLTAMWDEFIKYILPAKSNTTRIDKNSGDFASWVASAISAGGYTAPEDFAYDSAGVLQGIIQHESSSIHCYATEEPLAGIKIHVGQPQTKKGTPDAHYHTDFGLGFCQVQPYNRVSSGTTYNLYLPDENMVPSSRLLKNMQPDHAVVSGPNARVWHALCGYNTGNSHNSMTPDEIRADPSLHAASKYADDCFNTVYSSATMPHTNSD